MADDKSNVGGQDRSRVSGSEDYEVRHFAEANGISVEQAEQLLGLPAGTSAVAADKDGSLA